MKFIQKNCFIMSLVLISILAIFVTNHNDFLYQETILKITKIETIHKDTSTNPLGLSETYYNQKISGIVQNGIKKGTKMAINYEKTTSSVVTENYHVGDKVFVTSGSIEGLKRDQYVVFMIVFFVLSIVFVGKFRGLLAVISVCLNATLFYVGLKLYFSGLNLLMICMMESIFFTIISLLMAGGWKKKTMAAILSVLCSMIFLFIGTLILVHQTNYSGIRFDGMSFLTVPVEDVFLAELLIGGLGAIMDIAITLSSSISELIEKNPTISIKSLKKSAQMIGEDIMGSMVNVLFFTYFCSGLPVFVLAFRNGFSLHNYITTNFTLEITRFLIGGIGIVLAIPISSAIAIHVLKRGGTNE